MPVTNKARQAVLSVPQPYGTPVTLASRISPTFLFNSDSLTNQDDAYNPVGVYLEDDSTHANVYRTTVPFGATYLTLMHSWIIESGSGDSDPTTLPIVRAFGAVPRFSAAPGEPDDGTAQSLGVPYTIGLPNFPTGTFSVTDWVDFVPLGNMNTGAFALTLGSIAAPKYAWSYNPTDTYRRSEPQTIHLRGCTEVLVLIETAAFGPTSGGIIGNFEF